MGVDTAIAIGAAAIAVITLFIKLFDKSLSIREHDEFRQALRDQFALMNEQIKRDINRLEHRLDVIEQTRPTTGELEARLKPNSLTP